MSLYCTDGNKEIFKEIIIGLVSIGLNAFNVSQNESYTYI